VSPTLIALVICFLVAYWLFICLNKKTRLLENKIKNHEALQKDYHQLEQTLATRGRRLDVLLSTVSEVVLRVDKLGRVLGGNTQASDLFKFGEAPKLPQSMLIFYRDSEWLSSYQQAINALPKQLPLPEIKINGRIFSPRLAALEENEALLLCMDVTAYMQLQQKQKSLLENLMHDLKTPLTSLLGYARSIEAFADDVDLRQEAVSVIAQEAKHINHLMNSMLTLNQIEYQQVVATESCDVVAVARQVWGALQVQMKQKRVSFNFHATSDVLQAKMTEADCHRVLMNIADNALKYSPSQSSLECLIEENEDGVLATIQDNGCGIAEQYLSRVTERFYQVDEVRARGGESGHGLGLAIVKETLERDGGSLLLQNSDEGGLTVRILFPKV